MLPQEYAVSGWFKWEQISMQPWYNAFRVTLKPHTKSTDAAHLGDRTLTMWVGGP